MASLKFIFMDAGQGDATLVVYPDNSLMLIDCGSTKNSALVKGEVIEVLRRYLPKTSGGKTIETLVLTHPDIDHYNMLPDINRELKIEYNHVIHGGTLKEYGSRREVEDFLTNAKREMRICEQPFVSDTSRTRPNTLLSRSDVKGWVLAANYPNASHPAKNDKSVVILLEYQDVKVFLMGDAVNKTELAILDRYKSSSLLDPPSSKRVALKVGHHGSPTSSSEDWIKRIKPQMLFISSDTARHRIPKLSLINQITDNTELHAGDAHDYIYFDDVTAPPGYKSEKVKDAIYTTLYKLKPETGGSYYYTINDNGSVDVSRTDCGASRRAARWRRHERERP